MQKRTLGSTGLEIGEVGLGCWQFGGDFGAMDAETGRAILEAAVAHGVDFFDTADVYGGGRSESWIGEFLHQTGADVTVATKLGRNGIYPDGYSLDSLRAATQQSIDRLGVETLDLTQLHCVPTQVLRDGDIFGWMDRLKADGLTQHYGASVESVEEALLCLEHPGCETLQVIFNIFRPKMIDELFAKARTQNVGIIVRLPLASGLLSGKFTRTTKFAEQDHRHYNRDGQAFNVGETFAGLPYETGVDAAEAVKALVPAGTSMAQMALRWVLDHDAVSTIIPGASRSEHVASNAAASGLPPLSAELHASFRRHVRENVEPHIRGPY
ncbi:MAG: aldo/keto reductase [Planctomycetota bacterium]